VEKSEGDVMGDRIARWTWLFALVFVVGCAARDVVMPSPLAPAQTIVGAAVAIEDLTEDAETDQANASVLEMASDVLNLPWRLATAMTAIAGGFVWTLVDLPIHGYEKGTYDKRVDAILDWLPHKSAMPE